jgi:hypothetical protein
MIEKGKLYRIITNRLDGIDGDIVKAVKEIYPTCWSMSFVHGNEAGVLIALRDNEVEPVGE